MSVLGELIQSKSEVLQEIVERNTGRLNKPVWDDNFDNRPTWDNWGKRGKPFDNRPSWDNWNKKEKR